MRKGWCGLAITDMSFTVCHILSVLPCLTELDRELVDWFGGFHLLLLKIYCAIYCIWQAIYLTTTICFILCTPLFSAENILMLIKLMQCLLHQQIWLFNPFPFLCTYKITISLSVKFDYCISPSSKCRTKQNMWKIHSTPMSARWPAQMGENALLWH